MDEVSPFERQRILQPAPEQQVLQPDAGSPGALLSGDCSPPRSWKPGVDMIEASPDVLPVISHVDGHEGLLVASGFSGHGFGIGPGAGKLIADMVRGVADRNEVRAFRLQRFFDGSPIRPGPAI